MEFLSILIPVVNAIMAVLLTVMPMWLSIVCWSAATSVVVMLLYRCFSPQEKMTGIIQEMKPLQKQMLSLDASPEEAMTASLKYLRLSLQRMGMTLVPMLLSSLPALLVWAALASFYQQPSVSPYVLPVNLGWPAHWLSVFLFFSIIFSLALKIVLRIK